MRAILAPSPGHSQIVTLPEPGLNPNTILVRPSYVGNNPCDAFVSDFPSHWHKDQVVGCDYAGTVAQIGPDVDTDLKPGDKVFGVLAGGTAYDHGRGAFAETITAYGDLCFRVPKGVSEADAASLGVGLSTIAVSFYHDFGIPLPDEEPQFGKGKAFFVYGGSSTTGLLAIQFAKLSGFRAITTCSPRNFGLVKQRGADEVYDYHDLDKCAADIKASVGDDLDYAYVCIAGEEPPKLCAQILSTKGSARYVTIAGGPCPRTDVKSETTYGQSIMAETYKTFSGTVVRTAERKGLGLRVWKMALRLLEEGKVVPPPVEVREGLEGALQGIADLREGKVSGRKIVSRME